MLLYCINISVNSNSKGLRWINHFNIVTDGDRNRVTTNKEVKKIEIGTIITIAIVGKSMILNQKKK